MCKKRLNLHVTKLLYKPHDTISSFIHKFSKAWSMNCRVQDNLLEWNSILIIHIIGFRFAQATSPTFKVHLIGDCHSIHYAPAKTRGCVCKGISFCKRYEHIRRYTILIEIEASLHGWEISQMWNYLLGMLDRVTCLLLVASLGVGYPKTPRELFKTMSRHAAHLHRCLAMARNHSSVCQRRSKITNE